MLFKEFAGIDAWPLCLDTKDTDEIIAIVKAIAPGLRRHQPGGHRRAPLLRDRGPAAARAGHPRLPRRPARHRGGRAGRAAQRRPAGRKAAGRAQGRAGRRRRRRRRRQPSCCWRRASPNIIGCDREGALHPGKKGLTAIKKWYAKPHQPAEVHGHRRRGAGGRRRVPRPVRARARSPSTRCDRWRPTRSCSRWQTRRPRCRPEEIENSVARVIATGRSDYPTRSTTCSAFPGMFRGALRPQRRPSTRR